MLQSRLVALLLLCALSSSWGVVAASDRRTSDEFQDFLAHFLHHGYLAAPEVDATEEFRNHCVKPHDDRLHYFKPSAPSSSLSSGGHHRESLPSSGPVDDAATGTFRKGSAFLATDLCAMGHTAKDAPLLMSWAMDAEAFIESEVMHEAFGEFCKSALVDSDDANADESEQQQQQQQQSKNDHRGNNETSRVACIVPSHRREEQAEMSHKKHSPPLRYLLFGNMCMCRDPKERPNKRSPVFHSVLWGWFRAVTGRIGALRKKRRALQEQQQSSVGDAKKDSNTNGDGVEEIFMTGDFTNIGGRSTAKFKTLCFENIVVRKERWRWVRDTFHADQFRIALWSHFRVDDRNQVAKLTLLKPQYLSSSSSASASPLAFADHMLENLRPTLHSRNGRFARISRMPLDEQLIQNTAELVYSLRSRFPSSLLPLRVTVLVRDEDRHFYEPAVGHFIQHRFGSELVDVRLEKFDKLSKNDKHSAYQPPSNMEQLQILYDTDILVAAHGAGLAAVLTMRPGTAVIEFFPHNFKYYMYEEAAQLARVHYRRYESPQVWPSRCCRPNLNLYKSNFSKPMFLNGLGARACKGCDTFVTEEVVEELVAEAIRQVVLAHN